MKDVEKLVDSNGVVMQIVDGAARDMISAEYDETESYAVGDYCIYNDHYYKCITAIPSGGETWDATHWSATTLGAEDKAINTKLTKSTPTFTWESNVSTQYPPSYDAFMFNGAVWCAIRVVITIAGSSWVKIGKVNKKPSFVVILPAINSSDPSRTCMVQIDTNGDIYIY